MLHIDKPLQLPLSIDLIKNKEILENCRRALAHMHRGSLTKNEKDLTTAMTIFDSACEHKLASHIEKAFCFHEMAKSKRLLLQLGLTTTPNDHHYNIYLIEQAILHGNIARKLVSDNTSIQHYLMSIYYIYTLIVIDAKAGHRLLKAASELLKLSQQLSNNELTAHAHHCLFYCNYFLGKYNDAEAHFNEFAKLSQPKPSDYRYHAKLLLLKLYAGNEPKDDAHFKPIFDELNKSISVHKNKSLLIPQDNNTEELLKDFELLIQLHMLQHDFIDTQQYAERIANRYFSTEHLPTALNIASEVCTHFFNTSSLLLEKQTFFKDPENGKYKEVILDLSNNYISNKTATLTAASSRQFRCPPFMPITIQPGTPAPFAPPRYS